MPRNIRYTSCLIIKDDSSGGRNYLMNGIVILVCILLFLVAISLLIERDFIGLILFCVALFLLLR